MRRTTVNTSDRHTARPGMILLEVVLALALFVLAGGVVLDSVRTSTRAAVRLELEVQAADLLVTMTSGMQMGLVPIDETEPTGFESERLAGWTWQMDIEEELDDLKGMQQIRVTVAHVSGVRAAQIDLMEAPSQ